MPKGCCVNRWGTGTCTPSDMKEPQSKEMSSKLQQLMADRERQDTQLWGSAAMSVSKPTPNDQKYNIGTGKQTTLNTRG